MADVQDEVAVHEAGGPDTPGADEDVQLDLGELDITTEDIDLDGLESDMDLFAENPLVKEALAKGNLRQYSRQIENDLRDVERASIQDYINESDNLADLHSQIRECDNILEAMENMLTGFQGDLGNISAEIKHLQDQSLDMNIKIKNRKGARSQLAEFIDKVVVPPDLVLQICESEVNEQYLEYLQQLNRKIGYVDNQMGRESAGVQYVEKEMEKLRTKAVVRIREFLLQRILALKKPKTNIQILQQNVLLKFKYFNEFLAEHNPEAAQEIVNAYVETMGKLLHSNFKSYINNLLKLQHEVATKHDLLGADEVQKKGFFGGGSKSKGDVFSLGQRGVILDEINQPAIIYHVAHSKGQKFPFECLFRSMTCLLMDTATSEFLFLSDFFGKKEAPNLFQHVFAKSMSVFSETLENYLFNCWDAIGVLLMIRINYHHQLIMTRRRLPCLDSFCDRVNMLLWPRFKMIFDTNIQSLRASNPKALQIHDIQPHLIMRRYAQFAASILQLNAKYEDDMLIQNLIQLRREAESLLMRMASEFSDNTRQTLFCINNYDMILSVYGDAGVQSVNSAHFEEQLQGQISKFVEGELMQCFGRLLGFVKHFEPLVANASEEEAQQAVPLNEVEVIVKDFNQNWKSGLEQMNSNVMKFFSNFRNGRDILQQVLSQMVLYYTRFLEVLKKSHKRPPFQKDIITVPTIMFEIRKYGSAFET